MIRATRNAIGIAALTATAGAAPAQEQMKPYPEADPGMVRTAFEVPAAEVEADHRVELLVGKVVEVDCNRSFFAGSLERRVAQGWGYPYFIIDRIGPRAGTRMACPPATGKSEDFVRVRGDGFLVRYNSLLPVVVYVPEGFEVRYRIWSAGARIERAEPR